MAANRTVSSQLEALEKSIAGLKKDVRRVENSLTPVRLGVWGTILLLCWTGALVAEGVYQAREAYGDLLDKLPFVEGPGDRADKVAKSLDLSPLRAGDKVAGLIVTSIYLDPDRDNHRGVDLAGPSGTPYFAPGDVTVECLSPAFTNGGGYVAEFRYMDMLWQLMHLLPDTCVPGQAKAGAKIGELGSTGNSTGPHLHLQLSKGSQIIEPKRGHAALVLIPNTFDEDEAIAFIKDEESFRSCAYFDYAQYSNGWGTKANSSSECIDQAEADQRLAAHLDKVNAAIDKHVAVPLNQSQRTAITSFVYNVGEANFANSQLLRSLNSGDYRAAANEFDKWVHADGQRLEGLVRRRAREKALFLGK